MNRWELDWYLIEGAWKSEVKRIERVEWEKTHLSQTAVFVKVDSDDKFARKALRTLLTKYTLPYNKEYRVLVTVGIFSNTKYGNLLVFEEELRKVMRSFPNAGFDYDTKPILL